MQDTGNNPSLESSSGKIVIIYDNEVLTAKIDLLKLAIIEGCNDYYRMLNESESIYTSVNNILYHGANGKERVNKVYRIIITAELTKDIINIEYLIYSIIITRSNLLSDLICKYVLATGIYAEQLIHQLFRSNDNPIDIPGDRVKSNLVHILKKNIYQHLQSNDNADTSAKGSDRKIYAEQLAQLSQYLDHEINFDPTARNANDYQCLFSFLHTVR
jgi:hypothetical protein